MSCGEGLCLQRAAPLFSWQKSVFYLRTCTVDQVSACGVGIARALLHISLACRGDITWPSFARDHLRYWQAKYTIVMSMSPGRVAFRNLSILKVDSNIKAAPMQMHRPRTGAVPTLIYIWTLRSLSCTRVARAAQADHRTSQQAAILQYGIGPSGMACSPSTELRGEQSPSNSTLHRLTKPLMIQH